MTYKLSIRNEAEADIAEAYQYYESGRENLGTEFISCIDEAISRIQNNPKQFRTVLEKVRRAGIRNIGNRAHKKRMQSDQSTRYARVLAADARRYLLKAK